jgi:branched-chain amino acid transport system permease protein
MSAGRRALPASFLVPLVAAAVAVAVIGYVGSAYLLTVLIQVATYGLATLGLTILVGYAGQISFGHTVFLGLGGYLSALATTSWGLNPLLGVLAGVLASTVAAVLIGYPTLRLSGHYLAMATFAVALAFYALAARTDLFNGFIGIAGIPPLGIGSLTFDTLPEKFWLAWTVALLGATAAFRLRHMRFGRAMRTIAGDQATAAGLGIDVLRTKVVALVISAIFCSVAGSLAVHTISFASPESYGFAVIVQLFVMLFVGGLGSVWGALAGALAVIGIPELLGDFSDYEPTVFGIVLIAILILRPVGLLASLPQPGGGSTVARLSRRLMALGPRSKAVSP